MQVQTNLRPAATPVAAEATAQSLSASGQSADVYSNSCKQYLQEHDKPNQPSYVPQWMACVLGQSFTRRISNFFSCLGLPQFYPAQRNYPIQKPSAETDELAQRFLPRLSSISKQQSQDLGLAPSEIRYEVLPLQAGKDCESIIYYLGLPSEELPLPVIGALYTFFRPLFYGTKKDWEGVQIDFDKTSKEPVSVTYETSNYSNDPGSYNLISPQDLHLLARVYKVADGTWRHEVRQKNGNIQTKTVPNPFADGNRLQLTFVSWNSGLELSSLVMQNDALKLYQLQTPTPKFLDIDTYRYEGIDLRMGWLSARKSGKLVMTLPARAPGSLQGSAESTVRA